MRLRQGVVTGDLQYQVPGHRTLSPHTTAVAQPPTRTSVTELDIRSCCGFSTGTPPENPQHRRRTHAPSARAVGAEAGGVFAESWEMAPYDDLNPRIGETTRRQSPRLGVG